MLKRFFACCVTWSVVMLCGYTVWANAPTESYEEAALFQYGSLSQPQQVSQKQVNSHLYDTVLAGLTNMDESIDVAAYQLLGDDAGLAELHRAYSAVVNDNPQLFYVGTTYGYITTGEKIIAAVVPKYTMSVAEAAKKTAFFNATVQKIVSCTTGAMTDFEKVVVVHDYFVLHYEYDLTLSNYSALSLFEDKKGVCQAYALGFMAVMKELGIPCSMVTSDKMVHAWNMVQLGDDYYHVDVTWDDPTEDLVGRVRHRFLLLDDATISSHTYDDDIHHDWSAPAEAKNNQYVNSFFTDITSPILYVDGAWYYIDDREIVRRIAATGAEESLHTIDATWDVWGNSAYYYSGVYSGLGWFDGMLYYNTPREIYMLHPQTGEAKLFQTPETEKGLIYGIYTDNNLLVYGLSTSPELRTEQYSLVLAYLQGDVDCDGYVTVQDATYILRYLTAKQELTPRQRINADLTGDEAVTIADAVRVLELAL